MNSQIYFAGSICKNWFNIESTCRDVKYISESKPLNPFYLKSQLDFFFGTHFIYKLQQEFLLSCIFLCLTFSFDVLSKVLYFVSERGYMRLFSLQCFTSVGLQAGIFDLKVGVGYEFPFQSLFCKNLQPCFINKQINKNVSQALPKQMEDFYHVEIYFGDTFYIFFLTYDPY